MLFIPIAFATDNAALDHEGWAVGVAALWGYFINFDDYNDTISATYNTVIVTKSIFREEPFRGIAIRACTIRKTISFT